MDKRQWTREDSLWLRSCTFLFFQVTKNARKAGRTIGGEPEDLPSSCYALRLRETPARRGESFNSSSPHAIEHPALRVYLLDRPTTIIAGLKERGSPSTTEAPPQTKNCFFECFIYAVRHRRHLVYEILSRVAQPHPESFRVCLGTRIPIRVRSQDHCADLVTLKSRSDKTHLLGDTAKLQGTMRDSFWVPTLIDPYQ